MANSQWRKVYEIYNSTHPEIDEQHKRLFDILVELEKNPLKTKTQDEIRDFIKRIREYEREHFRDEEALMKEIEYPGYEEHRKEHQEFAEQMDKIIKRTEDTSMMFTQSFIDYIKSWLIGHMLGTDKEFADYLEMVEDGR